MLKKLAILLGIFLFLGIITTAYAQTQITDCPDKCENSTLFLKGALDPKLKICVYGIREPCKYGCENTSKIPICKEFPDKPPTNATDYDETIWNMMKKLWDKEKVKSGISIQVGGTEYDVSDGYGKVFLQMLDNQKNPISNATCFSKIFYPNSSVWLNDAMMTYATEGLHYSDFVIPNITGVFMVSAYCTIPISVNTTAWDNFECDGLNCGSGWVNNWSTSGACEVRSDGSPIGNYHMRCSYTGALGQGNASRGINLSTCATGQLSFWAKAQGLEVGDFCRYQYWNGTALAELLSITNPNDDNTYRFYSFEVCSAYGKSANSAIYFNATVNAAGDNCWIDNINFTLTSPSNLTEYQILRGSGEIHITNHVDNILGAITSVNTTANTMLLNYLITINSTTYQINQSLYSDYISLLTAINSVNMTANQTLSYVVALNGSVFNFSITELSYFQQTIALLNDINYALNTTLEYKLDMINGTVNQINQSQNAYYLSLLGAVEGVGATLNGSITQYLVYINGTTHNLSVNEFNHYLSILEAINSVNYTANTTLENKLDYLNSTIIPLLYEINATTNTTLQLVAQINQTMLQNYLSLYNFLTTLENKLDLINSTVIQINDTVNNLNFTIDLSQVLAAISQVNSTVNQNQQYLISINGTAYQINGTLASILQAIYDSNSSITSQLSTINGNILNLNSSEFQHYNDLYVILKDINFTTNTTLEYKLDLINYTTWQSWIMLQNLTIGNVSVTANVNWAEGVPIIWNASGQPQIDYNLLSLSDKGIQLTTETLTCLSNTTLQHMLNITNCIQGTCQNYNQTIVETCSWGCGNNQCIPAPQFQYMFAIGFALILIGVIYVGWRVAK
jgi:hypothetical protein